jgi:hypothetical protein
MARQLSRQPAKPDLAGLIYRVEHAGGKRIVGAIRDGADGNPRDSRTLGDTRYRCRFHVRSRRAR